MHIHTHTHSRLPKAAGRTCWNTLLQKGTRISLAQYAWLRGNRGRIHLWGLPQGIFHLFCYPFLRLRWHKLCSGGHKMLILLEGDRRDQSERLPNFISQKFCNPQAYMAAFKVILKAKSTIRKRSILKYFQQNDILCEGIIVNVHSRTGTVSLFTQEQTWRMFYKYSFITACACRSDLSRDDIRLGSRKHYSLNYF